MNPTTQPTLQAALGQELKHELAITRRVLERAPTEQFGWQPHAKSMTLGTLVGHMANLVGFLQLSLQGPTFDVATATLPGNPDNAPEMLARFDLNAEGLHQALGDIDEATFNELWSLTRGDQTLLAMPRAAVARTLVLNHLIHHRGQLSVYLRLLDIPVPAIYGGSADEAPRR